MAFSRRLELKTIERMLQIYCQAHHGQDSVGICGECRQLLDFASQRLDKCPFGENKPVCSECTVHCYQADQREAVRRVMRYAGPRMLYRSPLLTIRYIYRKRFKSTP